MAKSFIYDSIGFTEATTEDGSKSGSTFNPSGAVVTNHQRANDQSIGTVITNFNSSASDTIQFTLDSAGYVDVIALYFTASEADDMELFGHFSSSTNMGNIICLTTNFVKGWNVFDITEPAHYKYLFLYAATGNISNLAEVIIGTKYDFDVNFDLSNKIGEEFGTDIVTSYGGNEYSNKRHEPKTTWDWNWSYMLDSHKTSLESLNSNVQDWKKFIYYDETTYHYVRMTKPMVFTEVAPNTYSTSVSLREQLS